MAPQTPLLMHACVFIKWKHYEVKTIWSEVSVNILYQHTSNPIQAPLE